MADSFLKKEAFQIIQRGSKSFFLAGLILPKSVRDDAFLLYQWCRYCDDAIDESPKNEKLERLHKLEFFTRLAFQRLLDNQAPPAFRALEYVMHKYRIPEHYPLELLEGMRMDVLGKRYKNVDELLLYCYRVAGVVGLMMAHVIGVSHPRSLKNACDLGIAMQLTNICRDIKADFEMGRIYCPIDLLKQHHVPAEHMMMPSNCLALFEVVKKLLSLADKYYESGSQGLRYLGLRTAIAIQAASWIYASIGYKILRKGPSALEHRSIVSPHTKLFIALYAAGRVLLQRIFLPWKWQRKDLEYHVYKFKEQNYAQN